MENNVKDLQYINFAQYIIANKSSDKIAVIDDEKSMTYNELIASIKSFANQLKQRGIMSGDPVMVNMDERVEWAVAFLSLIYIGATVVLTSNRMGVKVLTEISDVCRARAVIWQAHDDEFDKVLIQQNIISIDKKEIVNDGTSLEEYYQYDPDEICIWGTSSGTMGGKRKYILHRHAAIYLGTQKMIVPYNFTSSSVIYTTPKLSFLYGFNELMLSLTVGATDIISNRIPVKDNIIDTITKNKVTHFITTPTPVVHMVKHDETPTDMLKQLEVLIVAGEPLPKSIAVKFQDVYGIPLLDGHGMCESMNVTLGQTPDCIKLGTMGKPLPGVECEIRRPDGMLCAPNEPGILYLKDASQAICYHNNWSSTKFTFCGAWMRTNDVCYVDDEGFYTYVCRNDELLKVNGLLVTPTEIENILLTNPTVDECVVTHCKNRHGLDEIEAYIVLRDGKISTITDIKEFLSLNIEDYKIPKTIRFVTELPKTVTSKKIRNNSMIQNYYLDA